MSPSELLQRWFPDKGDKIHHTILWNLTAYPAGDAAYIENQLKWAAIRTMPELSGFETRLDEAMCEVLDAMDHAHEEGKRREAEAGKA
jgi:hypothetical protein